MHTQLLTDLDLNSSDTNNQNYKDKDNVKTYKKNLFIDTAIDAEDYI